MLIAIASDHGGVEVKGKLAEQLEKKGYDITDCGCDSKESCDYPDFAKKALKLLIANEVERVILICSTGLGMSIVANKYDDRIRAAVAFSKDTAKQSREHLDANVLCLGAQEFDNNELFAFTRIWLETEFSHEERHQRRINKLINK